MLDAARLRRFEAKCIPEPMSGCKLWFGGADPRGYGHFWNGKCHEGAHRFAYKAAGNELAQDDILRHKCDTPACVEVSHLIKGTNKDNTADMWTRRRAIVTAFHGSVHPRAKLTDADVAAIRSRAGENQRALAEEFNISKSVVSLIINNKLWRKESGVVHSRGGVRATP